VGEVGGQRPACVAFIDALEDLIAKVRELDMEHVHRTVAARAAR
jgi:hypothetical protein